MSMEPVWGDESPDMNPYLRRAIVLRAWIDIRDTMLARQYLHEHGKTLRDPITIALLIFWQRRCQDPDLAAVLAERKYWLLPG